MRYTVYILSEDKKRWEGLIYSDNSLEDAIDFFIKVCREKTAPDHSQLLGPAQFCIMNEYDRSEAMMVWAKNPGIENPVLVTQIKKRNVLMIYNVDGSLVSHKKLK